MIAWNEAGTRALKMGSLNPPPPSSPPLRRCASCGYHYAPEKMDKRGEQFFCKDVKACAGRILYRKRERELQRSWKR